MEQTSFPSAPPRLHSRLPAAINPTGLIVPLATPFEKDLRICQSACIEHLSFLVRQGVTRILAGGTTAEFFSMSSAERLTLLKLAREHFPGLIIFNISAESMATTCAMAREACRCGADALICLPPYYYAGAPVSGLIAYFSSIAGMAELPLYLYNFPRHTGNPITPEILKAVPNAGLKDSSGEFSLIAHTTRYLLGGDARIVEAYRQGACGYVPGLPNVFPEIYLSLERMLDAKEYESAEMVQNRIALFKKSLPKISGIVVIKKYLNRILDSYPVAVRPPLDASIGSGIDLSNTLK